MVFLKILRFPYLNRKSPQGETARNELILCFRVGLCMLKTENYVASNETIIKLFLEPRCPPSALEIFGTTHLPRDERLCNVSQMDGFSENPEISHI